MKISDIQTHIRLALLDLGRDPHIGLPSSRAKLDATLRLLRIEQSVSAKSKLLPSIKAEIAGR